MDDATNTTNETQTASARASFALYNTLDEADALVDALNKARTFFA